MILLSGADLVLADRILSPGRITLDEGRIVAIESDSREPAAAGVHLDFRHHYIVPGFVDVHVHGIEGHDSLGEPDSIARIAERLPRYGVTAFCPTTVACSPSALREVLDAVRAARVGPIGGRARVLPAHLESNFINPEYRGAQPMRCLRLPPPIEPASDATHGEFTGADILAEIERASADVGIVTLAPELPGGVSLIRRLAGSGHRVSLGHSAATCEQAVEAIAAGARHATHLFNRMPPLHHREPGLAGAVLASDEIAAELICDGHHVHPVMLRNAIAAKHPSRVMAITDGTAGSGLSPGMRTKLGDQIITVRETGSFLDDGTLAGSVLTMEKAFRLLVGPVGLSPVDAVRLCSTTPAGELGLHGHGVLSVGGVADLVVLNSRFEVVQTYIAGQLAYSAR